MENNFRHFLRSAERKYGTSDFRNAIEDAVEAYRLGGWDWKIRCVGCLTHYTFVRDRLNGDLTWVSTSTLWRPGISNRLIWAALLYNNLEILREYFNISIPITTFNNIGGVVINSDIKRAVILWKEHGDINNSLALFQTDFC